MALLPERYSTPCLRVEQVGSMYTDRNHIDYIFRPAIIFSFMKYLHLTPKHYTPLPI